MKRRQVARVAAPVAFLAAVTIGALVVRAGFQHGNHHAAPSITTVTTGTMTTRKHRHRRSGVRTYTVQSGDTFESIATRERTTVARLEQLNPGVDPTTLRVGEKIRVQ
jgi:Tfp pilus assembly protein FimV